VQNLQNCNLDFAPKFEFAPTKFGTRPTRRAHMGEPHTIILLGNDAKQNNKTEKQGKPIPDAACTQMQHFILHLC